MSYIFEFHKHKKYMLGRHFHFIKLFLVVVDQLTTVVWYRSCWFGWVCLTIYLYYNSQVRDLGPSYDIFDYNPDIDMGFYRTIGPILLICWILWTYAANSAFTSTIYYLLNTFFWVRYIWRYWYEITIYSYIKMHFISRIGSLIDTNFFIMYNYFDLLNISCIYYYFQIHKEFLNFSTIFITPETKATLLWFPWSSFFNYLTVLSLIYVLTFVSIYNTENQYYLVLYFIFLVFLFSATLVSLDLDIFAGLLLLIESVVILMFFFLIIYLAPNINFNQKIQKWRVYIILFIILTLLSSYSYMNLGEAFFPIFSLPIYILDDFYEAWNDVFINDLTGIFIGLYWTNSIVLFIIGILLLIASIICVVLISFFTKLRNFNMKTFLNIFDVFKTCYSFIFLRKQNLAKQGRSVTSTKIFTKKTFDSTLHTEYKEKHEIYEKKKKEEAKLNIKNDPEKKI